MEKEGVATLVFQMLLTRVASAAQCAFPASFPPASAAVYYR